MSKNLEFWNNLHQYQYNGYSQSGEQGILRRIFDCIGGGGKYCVEFGAKDGKTQSNTRSFIEDGWDHLLMDCSPGEDHVKKEFITAENVNDLFDKYGVPDEIDLLSIDIDGNDYWVWKAIERKARVVIIECNPTYDQTQAVTIKYNPEHAWSNDHYYGASPLAMKMLGEHKGMEMVYMNRLNCVFVDKRYLPESYSFVLRYVETRGWPPNKSGTWYNLITGNYFVHPEVK